MSGPALDGVSFALRVPDSWFLLEVDPQLRQSALEELVETQVRDVPELREHRATISRIVREQATIAWDSGVALCAVMVDPTEDGPLTATVTVSVLSALTGIGQSEPDRLLALAAPFTPQQASGPDAPWRDVSTVQVDGAGPAVRAAGVQDVPLPEDSGLLRVVLMQTVVPLPRNRAMLVTCTSPVLPLADVLLDVFDAISGTLRVVVDDRAERASA